MIELQRKVARPVVAEVHGSVNRQLTLLEAGTASQLKIRAMSHRVKGEVARSLFVEGEVAQTNLRVDDRLVGCATTLSGEIHPACNCHARLLKLGEPQQVKVGAAE